MDLIRLALEDLIPVVEAQGADTSAQPTFGTLTVGGGTSTSATVTLTSDSTNVKVGDTFTVQMEVATGNFSINEYRLVVNFDPAKLRVVDAQSNNPGTQIELTDTIFQVSGNNNNVSAAGLINLIASTPSGNALQVNRNVARITFQAQSTGVAVIQPVSGIDGTQLINENGIAIASTLNSLTINLSQTGSTTSAATSSTSSSISTSNSTSSAGGGQLPQTGIAEDVVAAWPVAIGVLLVMIGYNLRRNRNSL